MHSTSLSRFELGRRPYAFTLLEALAGALQMPVSVLVELGEQRAEMPAALAKAEAVDAATRERAWVACCEYGLGDEIGATTVLAHQAGEP